MTLDQPWKVIRTVDGRRATKSGRDQNEVALEVMPLAGKALKQSDCGGWREKRKMRDMFECQSLNDLFQELGKGSRVEGGDVNATF